MVSGDTDVSRTSNDNIDNSTDKAFFSSERVGSGCQNPIEIRFETLIASNCELPYEWYKELGLDKGNASKIRRGLLIPSKEWRIMIASHFKTDSATIWPIDYKEWCEVHDAVENLWDKIGGLKNG